MRLSFGDFVLDRASRQLLCGGEEKHLEPKAYELLDLLLARRPEAVSKREIQERLWPDTVVSETSLTGLVTKVRQALGDGRKEPRYIRTVHGFGYAFSGDASEEAPGAEAGEGATPRVIWEERTIKLQTGENLLGRDEDVTVRIDAPGVSRRHARIVVAEAEVTLEDLGSKNGTFLKERRLDGPAVLSDGDTFRLGRQLLLFRSARETSSTLTESVGPRRLD